MLVFMTNDGFYAYLGGGKQPEPISEIIRGDIDDWSTTSIDNLNRIPAAIVWKNRYICSLFRDDGVAGDYSNTIYVYENGTWWKDIISTAATDDFTTSASTGTDFAILANKLYLASGNSNVLRQWERPGVITDTQDNGTGASVNFSYLTKEFDFREEQTS